MGTFTIERFDALAREVCRCFAEGDRIGVIKQLDQAANQTEAALMIALACGWMTPGVRKSFVDFLTLQSMSLSK